MPNVKRDFVDLDDVRNPIDQILRPIGFRANSKRLWDRENGRVIQVVHLDKSSYGAQNRLEIFFSLDSYVSVAKYKLGDFDVKINFDRISKHYADFKSALDQEKIEIPFDVRANVIQVVLKEILEPLLNLAADEQGICKLRDIMPSKNDLFIAPRTAALCSPSG